MRARRRSWPLAPRPPLVGCWSVYSAAAALPPKFDMRAASIGPRDAAPGPIWAHFSRSLARALSPQKERERVTVDWRH